MIEASCAAVLCTLQIGQKRGAEPKLCPFRVHISFTIIRAMPSGVGISISGSQKRALYFSIYASVSPQKESKSIPQMKKVPLTGP